MQSVKEKLNLEKVSMNTLVVEVEENTKEINGKVENEINEINSLQQNLSQLRAQLDVARKKQTTVSESYTKILLEKQSLMSQINDNRNQIDLLTHDLSAKNIELRETDAKRASLSSRHQNSAAMEHELDNDIMILKTDISNFKQLLQNLSESKLKIGMIIF